MRCTTSSISLEASKRCSRLLFWTGERLEAFTSSSTTASATTSSWLIIGILRILRLYSRASSDSYYLASLLTPEQAVRLCDRNFGIGADGVIFTLPGINDTDYTMRIFNSNGSEPEMCGNGVRCFARFITEIENLHGKQRFTVHTGAGLIVPEIADDGKILKGDGSPSTHPCSCCYCKTLSSGGDGGEDDVVQFLRVRSLLWDSQLCGNPRHQLLVCSCYCAHWDGLIGLSSQQYPP